MLCGPAYRCVSSNVWKMRMENHLLSVFFLLTCAFFGSKPLTRMKDSRKYLRKASSHTPPHWNHKNSHFPSRSSRWHENRFGHYPRREHVLSLSTPQQSGVIHIKPSRQESRAHKYVRPQISWPHSIQCSHVSLFVLLQFLLRLSSYLLQTQFGLGQQNVMLITNRLV